MSVLATSDGKNHPSPASLKTIHLVQPESQPDANGFSAAESETIKAKPLGFAEDFVREHSSAGAALAQNKPAIGVIGPMAPDPSKSVQP
jgi:hypothetical protein